MRLQKEKFMRMFATKERIISVILVLMLLLLGFAGCTPTEEAVEEPVEGSETEEPVVEVVGPPSVGLVLVGSINDGGWNASAYNGLKIIEEEVGSDVVFAENVKLSDMVDVMHTFASQEYDYVFGHGFETFDAALTVSKDYPDTRFVVTSSNQAHAPNIAGLAVANGQQGFLAGVVAAKLTETKIVGVIGGMNIPSIADFVEGAKLGIAYVDPSIKVLETYTGSFDDVAMAKEVAMSMVEAGADVICPDVSQADLGVYEAAKETGAMAIGAIGDMYERAPENIPTSITMSISLAMSALIEGIEDGSVEWGPKAYEMGVAQNVISIVEPKGVWVEKFSAEDFDYCKRVEEALRDGTLMIKGVTDSSTLPVVE
jgi:basic membrane protein A